MNFDKIFTPEANYGTYFLDVKLCICIFKSLIHNLEIKLCSLHLLELILDDEKYLN